MGNNPTKQQIRDRPKKNVHWKSAEPPTPPGKPIIASPPDGSADVVALKWDRPRSDGGSPVIGFFIEHRRTGSPHWVRATPSLILQPELTLNGLEPGWRYQFRIIAANVVGPSEPSELSETLTVTLQRNAVTTPQFTSEIIDQVVVENERVAFNVTAIGVPTPQVNWFKDGFEVFSSRRTKIINENNSSTLIIHQVALTDEGEIKCSATNRAGHVVTRALLKVEAPPKIRLPRPYEDGLLVEADDVIRLKVAIAGRPSPAVVWSHNGEVINNSDRYELLNTEKNSSLKIVRAHRSDRGEYHLRAINKLGEDSVSFLLTVTAKPSPPGRVIITLPLGKSVTLAWTEPSDDGGCMIGNYIVEYFRIGWNVWLKAITTRQLTATLNDLIEGSEYRFRVKAESPYGLSDPSDESETLFVPDPKRGIIKPSTDESSEFRKNVSARDIPEISLTKSNNDTMEKQNHKITGIPIKSKHNKTAASLKIDRSAGNDDPILKDSPLPIVEGKLSLDSFKDPQSFSGKTSRDISPIYANVNKSEKTTNKTEVELDKDKSTRKTNYNLTAPRDNTDEVHTSNEFMLVLYDDKKTLGKQSSSNQIIDSDIDDGTVPPPLSLSAPELGSELPVVPLLRHCVSSTELLFEKAMQRVYQTMENEELQQNKIKSQQHSQQQSMLSPKLATKIDNLSDDQCKSIEMPQNKNTTPPPNEKLETVNNNGKTDIEAVEDSDEDLEDIEEERDLKEEILQSQKLIGIYRSDPVQSNIEYSDDYTDSTASSAGSLDSLEKFIVTVKSVNINDDQELETYHPRMGPKIEISDKFSYDQLPNFETTTAGTSATDDSITQNSSLSDSSDTVHELKTLTAIGNKGTHGQNIESDRSNSISLSPNSMLSENGESKILGRPISPYRLPDSDQSTIELNKPLPLPDPNFVPKPILKKQSLDNDPPEKPKKPEKKGIMQLFTSKKSSSNTSLSSSQDKLKANNDSKSELKKEEPLSQSQKARLAMIERRQSSIEENKVAIDYYSDIVKERGGSRNTYMQQSPNEITTTTSQSKEQLDQQFDSTPNNITSNEKSTHHKEDESNKATKINVPRNKPSESYSRSIFAIKLSKDSKKTLQMEENKNEIFENRIEKGSDNIISNVEMEVSTGETNPNERQQNIQAIQITPEMPEEARGRPAVITKKTQIRNRSRSSSTARTNTRQNQQSSQNRIDQQKRLRSDSKSPATKNRAALQAKNKTIAMPDEYRQSPDIRCQTPEELLEETKSKVKSTLTYITDLAMFGIACWIYVFKDARWAIPILVLMIYRQAVAVLKDKCPKWTKLKKE